MDCLSGATLVTFLRQLRDGCISRQKGRDFPASIALIGMRNIRDFKAKIRPDRETLGSASPFNVITKAMTPRAFTAEEVAELYQQHTDATGQVFEPGVAALAYDYSRGQPYLVNALARWCMDEIHDRRFAEPITLADMHEAKEKIIRERGTHLDSLMERMKEPRVRRVVEPVMLGGTVNRDELNDDLSYVLDLGLLVSEKDVLVPANPMYAEIIGRYLSWGTQQNVRMLVPETPWASTRAGLWCSIPTSPSPGTGRSTRKTCPGAARRFTSSAADVLSGGEPEQEAHRRCRRLREFFWLYVHK